MASKKIITDYGSVVSFTGTGSRRVLLIAGVHGNEVTPIECLRQFQWLLESETDSNIIFDNFSTLTILNAVNIPALREGTRETPSPKDGDLNRFPSIHNQDKMRSILMDQIAAHDVIIDVHSSPNCTEFILINQDQFAKAYVDFANQIGINYLVRYSHAHTIKTYSQSIKTAAFTVELNGMDRIDMVSASAGIVLLEKLINGLHKLDFSILGLIPLEPEVPCHYEFKAHSEGLFTEKETQLGQTLHGGEILGELTYGERSGGRDVIYTGLPGKIIAGVDRSWVRPGDVLYLIQPLNEKRNPVA